MEDKIINVMASVLGVEENQISEDTSPDTVETWDSLQHMNLVAALEEEFKISLSDEEIREMMNYKLIRLIIREKVVLK
ncbi:acyl carrier protein [Candidatus Omnitrophota bacterium]